MANTDTRFPEHRIDEIIGRYPPGTPGLMIVMSEVSRPRHEQSAETSRQPASGDQK